MNSKEIIERQKLHKIRMGIAEGTISIDSLDTQTLVALSKVGISALVDEATGFQNDRQKDALHTILDKLIGYDKSCLPGITSFPPMPKCKPPKDTK